MQITLAKCPKINLRYKGYQIPSLLDSDSDVTLIQQSYFDENLMHLVRTYLDEKSEAPTLFHLTVANDEQLPITKYVELDLNFLVTRDPNQLLDPKHQTRLPGVVGWNLVHLAFKECIKLYGTAVSDSFDCTSGVSPLLFSQLCVYYYMDVCTIHTSGIHTALRTLVGMIDPQI